MNMLHPSLTPSLNHPPLNPLNPFTTTHHGISVELLEHHYWKVFTGLPLEMIACRKGRNLFPFLAFRITGLDPNQMYYIFLEFRRHGDKRYSYDPCQHKWTVALEEEDLPKVECVYECDISPKMGCALNGKEISFKHVKLVNTKQDRPELHEHTRKISDPKIFVHTKCFYRPYLIVRTASGPFDNGKTVLECHFPVTQFVTVTAYRNDQITELKIEHNPKARAFKIKKDRKHFREALLQEGDGSDEGNTSTQCISYPSGSTSSDAYAMYSPQDAAMYGYPAAHYGYHHQQIQASAQMIQPQDINNQAHYYAPLHYNNTDANLLPVATQHQQQHNNYIHGHMQNFASTMPATNGEAAGPYYVQAPQQQVEYVGVDQQQQQQFGSSVVQTSAESADLAQLNTSAAHNTSGGGNGYPIVNNVQEGFTSQPQNNNQFEQLASTPQNQFAQLETTPQNQFAQLETTPPNQFAQLVNTPPMGDTSVPSEQPHSNVWDGQQQHYQPLEQVAQQQQFYHPNGFDAAPSNEVVNNIEGQL